MSARVRAVRGGGLWEEGEVVATSDERRVGDGPLVGDGSRVEAAVGPEREGGSLADDAAGPRRAARPGLARDLGGGALADDAAGSRWAIDGEVAFVGESIIVSR